MKTHYFQRYHSKENSVTANTMLLLSQFYRHSPSKFFDMLQNFLLDAKESPEIAINMQVVGQKSVPDAVISQPSFKIIIETKLHNQFYLEQLTNHICEFKDEQFQVLLTLDPKPFDKKIQQELNEAIKQSNKTNLKHKHVTFEALIDAIDDYVDARDYDMVAILDDYKQYCLDENLLSDRQFWMRAITAGTTLNDNFDLNLYYDNETVGYSEHGFIGLYDKKRIKGIGKLIKTVVAYYENGKIIYIQESGSALTEEEKGRIKEAIERAKAIPGYDLVTVKHRYFLVDQFHKTNFYKQSKNAIQKSKFFNLAQMLKLKTLPEAADVAKMLDGKAWEDFE